MWPPGDDYMREIATYACYFCNNGTKSSVLCNADDPEWLVYGPVSKEVRSLCVSKTFQFDTKTVVLFVQQGTSASGSASKTVPHER
jgi:hypothetical protein